MKVRGRLEVRMAQGGKGEVLLDGKPLPLVTGGEIRFKADELNTATIEVIVDEVLVEFDEAEVEIRTKVIETMKPAGKGRLRYCPNRSCPKIHWSSGEDRCSLCGVRATDGAGIRR